MKKVILLLFSVITISSFISCEKDAHVKPDISFKKDAGYIYKDTTLEKNASVLIACNIKKTEDDLKTYSFAVGYDGATPSNRNTHSMTGSGEKSSYTNDERLNTRNQAGKEVYQFTATDADGNIASISLTVTVK